MLAVVNRVLWLNSTFCVGAIKVRAVRELSNDNSDCSENATKQKV